MNGDDTRTVSGMRNWCWTSRTLRDELAVSIARENEAAIFVAKEQV